MKNNDKIRMVRERLGLKQKDLAAIFGIKPGHYSAIESGKRSVTQRFIELLHDKYDVSPTWWHKQEGEILNSDNKEFAKSSQNDKKGEKNKEGFDLGAFVDAIVEATHERRPTRYANGLNTKELNFEFKLALNNLKDSYNDKKSLTDAMHKMGPPDFMIEKFPIVSESFDSYLKELESDYDGSSEHLALPENPDKLQKIEYIYHPATEHNREMLRKLINYLNQYGDMFEGGINKLGTAIKQ
jgi:transcriptional regulator with XRE-family HTH domain